MGGPGAGDVFTGPQVERAAALHGTVAPRYPATLRERGIEGSVTLRFVVDTAGRVEPASVVVVASTHDLFAVAARATLPTLRFTPAAAGGRPVRQLVELPFTFEIR
jgi:protein TonB